MTQGSYPTKKPVYHDECWECPRCEWLNPYPNVVLTSMPPQTPYRCNNCDYTYYEVHESKIDRFSMLYPTGKPKDNSSPTTKTEKVER